MVWRDAFWTVETPTFSEITEKSLKVTIVKSIVDSKDPIRPYIQNQPAYRVVAKTLAGLEEADYLDGAQLINRLTIFFKERSVKASRNRKGRIWVALIMIENKDFVNEVFHRKIEGKVSRRFISLYKKRN